MPLYKKKPIVIQAVQWTGKNFDKIKQELLCEDIYLSTRNIICIYTLEGCMDAYIGDYIIKGIKGEIYPCKEDIFEKTYEILT